MQDKELDLGIEPQKDKGECSPCCAPDSDQKRYPELCFRGDHADLFREKYGACAPGDEYEATLRLRVKVSADGENEYDKRIEFSVVAIIGDVVEEESTAEDDAPGEEAEPAPRRMGKKPAPAKEPAEKY